MSIIESLSMFLLPTANEQFLPTGYIDPWLQLLAAMAAFIAAAMSFIHRPLEKQKLPWLKISPVLVNALTLTVSMSLVHVVSVTASPTYQSLGFQPSLLYLPLLLTFALNFSALRMISFVKNSPFRMLMASGLIMMALILQNLMAYTGVNLASISQLDAAIYSLAAVIAGFLVTVAILSRFAAKKTGFWDKNLTSGLLSGACFTVASLIMATASTETVVLSRQPLRDEPFLFSILDVMLVQAFLAMFAIVFNQLANAWLCSHAEARLFSQREEQLTSILQTATEAIIAIDRKGNITYFNHSAERIFGWHTSEVLGKNICLLVTDEHQHRHDIYIHNYLERRMTSDIVGSVREVMAKRRDGSELPVRLSIGHHDSQGQHEFVAVISDISEQRSMAWALRENAKQYRALVSNLPCIAFREMTGATRHIVFISDAAKSLTGYSASILTGENGVSHFVDRIHQGDTASYRKVRELASRRHGKYDCEYRFLTRDDEKKWFWEIGHSYRAEDGSTWIDGVIIDVTEKHEAEQEFEEKMRLAEKATQSKASFLANMSYEFRSPMNSILGLTEVLIEEAKTPSHRHHLEVIRESGNSLLKLINDILDTSKLESQSLPLDIADFSLVQLCRQIEFIARETVQARDLHVSLHYNDALWEHYVGDSRRIKQLLQNLMRSALTKTEKGNVALHVLPTNDVVRFAVASYAHNQKTARVDEALNTGQTLSATLVTQLIELMSGHLWFDGESIHGSVVYADLPLIPAQSSKRIGDEPSLSFALPALEVLVIDDVQRNQQELRDMLLRQGVKVLTFTDMESAEDVLKTQAVDMVFLDAYLSDEHYPTPQTLRSWSAVCREEPLKVVAMKLAVDPTTDWQACGFDFSIDKPFIGSDIFSMLAKCYGGEEADNIATLNPPNENVDLFDDAWALQHWPTTDILLSVIREFYASYNDLPDIIRQLLKEQPEALAPLLKQAKEAAKCIGFPVLELRVSKLLSYLEAGDVVKAEAKLELLRHTLEETFDRALAYLGVRAHELEDNTLISKMPQEVFERKTEMFVSKLAEGQYDDELYKELVPRMAGFVSPPLLSQFVASIENFELDEAYRLILTVTEQMPTSQNTGVQGYGV
ncbi:PAS domain S-box protein [Grimontia sp. NTOU-MAR1]|uniref:PAS domain S-box protein n=1 Tax=Grimontia sp. NTOU-MAR1 TaxID=3111011 RepID=UPI002DBD6635|nr:PAS domain S-box protein [Grimontia sp. NTOU-MAR1]WRV96899.1 PAS domain S-box protein [Grimontia sp. NTOU-MAR1]